MVENICTDIRRGVLLSHIFLTLFRIPCNKSSKWGMERIQKIIQWSFVFSLLYNMDDNRLRHIISHKKHSIFIHTLTGVELIVKRFSVNSWYILSQKSFVFIVVFVLTFLVQQKRTMAHLPYNNNNKKM